jgi:hypothetical protein
VFLVTYFHLHISGNFSPKSIFTKNLATYLITKYLDQCQGRNQYCLLLTSSLLVYMHIFHNFLMFRGTSIFSMSIYNMTIYSMSNYRDWFHESNGQILTKFDQVSHKSTPSLDLRGNKLLLASGGTLPTFSLILGSYSLILGLYFLCLSSCSYLR